MPTPTIQESLKYANLQMAAEALYGFDANRIPNLVPGKPTDVMMAATLQDGNRHASKFPQLEAERFVAQWELVEHISNTTTGFSGTLMKNRDTGELVLSFRSTEFVDDSARDSEATNKLEIADYGWALGQISDMEEWYQSLTSRIDRPLVVTGYSLGGHLATAFNLLHGKEMTDGHAVIQSVYTFNGAGVGKIGDGSETTTLQKLPEMIQRFRELRTQARSTDGLASVLQSARGKTAYRALKTALVTTDGVPSAALLTPILNVHFEVDENYSPQELADYRLLESAVARAIAVTGEAHRAPTLESGSSNPDAPRNPANIPDASIAAETLDYQLAVLSSAAQYHARSRSMIGGALAAIAAKAMAEGAAPAPQYDIVGTEMDTPAPLAMVANSQWHYGQNLPVFIEDQPLSRGNVTVAMVIESVKAAGFKLLVPDYTHNDFGDTHSLVLLIDSLNLQNTLQTLAPALSEETRDQILRAATSTTAEQSYGTQGKAEGDALEKVVNAMSSIFLGSNAPAELKGPLDGNTWADINDRNSFYANLDQLTSANAFTSLAGQFTLALPGSGQGIEARSDFGAFLGLLTLSPFTLHASNSNLVEDALKANWASVFSDWDADRNRSSQQLANWQGTYTDRYLADRAAFLGHLIDANSVNKDVVGPRADYGELASNWLYRDVATDRTLVIPDPWFMEASSLPENQVIFAGPGNDSLNTGTGDDHLYGGDGSDSLSGGEGADHLEGNDDSDTLKGDDGRDTLIGGRGDDLLEGGKGSDSLCGGVGDDIYRLASGGGWDWVDDQDGRGHIEFNGLALASQPIQQKAPGVWQERTSQGTITYSVYDLTESGDTFQVLAIQGQEIGVRIKHWQNGGLGIALSAIEAPLPPALGRIIVGDYQPIDVSTEPGLQTAQDDLGNTLTDPDKPAPDYPDLLRGSTGNDLVLGRGGDDTISADGGDDSLEGGSGHDRISGGEGSDSVLGGSDIDILAGGPGDDWIYGQAEIGLAEAIAQAQVGPGTGLQGDWLNGGRGDDTLLAGADNDAVFGGSGDDILVGGSGDDILNGDDDYTATRFDWQARDYGNPFDRFCSPISINNVLPIAGGADLLYGGAGNDLLTGMQGNDILHGEDGNDSLAGCDGDDILIGGEGADSMTGDYGRLAYDSGSGAVLQGDDYLDGGAGNDWLQGESGADTLLGGAGNDTLIGDADYLDPAFHDADTLDGGDGNDVVKGRGGDDLLYGRAGNDVLDGNAGRDTIDGGGGDDDLSGGGDDDLLLGGAGDDLLFGDSDDTPAAEHGDDTLEGGDGNDYLRGYAGRDLLAGQAGEDQLEAGADDDLLDGGDADDTLFGQSGDDTLRGGRGSDYLAGGAGDDAYVFAPGDGPLSAFGATETISDEDGVDSVRFENVAASAILLFSANDGKDLVIDYGDDSLVVVDGVAGGIEHFEIGGEKLSRSEFVGRYATGGISFILADGSSIELGGPGDDEITTGGSFATVSGGRGRDTIVITGSQQIIEYSLGDGTDHVLGVGAGTSLRLGPGVGADDLTLGLGSLALQVGSDPEDTIHFAAFDAADPLAHKPFERVEFADGSRLSYEELLARGFDLSGSDGNDAITGTAVTDRLRGGTGDDTLAGAGGDDFLDGGSGNDLLSGGAGSDTYAWGSGAGNDVIDNGQSAPAEVDVLALTSDLAPADLAFVRSGDDLVIRLRSGAEQLVVRGHFAGAAIGSVCFAEGTAWTRDEIAARITNRLTERSDRYSGTAANDAIAGLGGNDTLSGLMGDDSLSGGDGDDVLYGGEGDDKLRGDAGRDGLWGNAGRDTLDGRGDSAADTLQGGAGSDVYLFGRGSGADTIVEDGDSDSIDVLRIDSGILPSEIRSRQIGLDRVFEIAGTADRITVDGTSSADALASARIESVEFADGTVWSEAEVRRQILLGAATAGADVIMGFDGNDSIDGLAGNDALDGQNGDDSLRGGDGDDTLSGGDGDDLLDGAGGLTTFHGQNGDWLYGGRGSDNYLFGRLSGTGTITESGGFPGDVDTIIVADGIEPADIRLQRWNDGWGFSNLIVSLASNAPGVSGSTLYLPQFFMSDSDATRIEAIRFSDGTVWHPADIETMLNTGTSKADTLEGDPLSDTLDGRGGNDTLNGLAGNDMLIGGGGDDHLLGGTGDDVYRYARGDGCDTIDESRTAGGFDTLELGPGIAATDVALYRVADDLAVVLDDSPAQLRVSGYFANANSRIERIRFADSSEWNSIDIDARIVSGTPNVMTGSAGNDLFVVDDVRDTIVEGADQGVDTVEASVEWTLGANLENLTLTGILNINGYGNSLPNLIVGNRGNNVLDGKGSSYQQGAPRDRLRGGPGDDIYYVRWGDVVEESPAEGMDTVISTDSFTVPDEVELLSLRSPDIPTYASIYKFTATGNSANNVIEARQGDNIDGKGGDDLMIFRPGFGQASFYNSSGFGGVPPEIMGSTAYVDSPGDRVVIRDADEGRISRVISSIDRVLDEGVGTLELAEEGSGFIGTGNALDNTIVGNRYANTLQGMAGNDTLFGGDGADTLLGGLGNDTLFGGNGADTLLGGLGNDTYYLDPQRPDGGTPSYLVYELPPQTKTIIEAENEGVDTVISIFDYTLPANVEKLILSQYHIPQQYGPPSPGYPLRGTGNELANTLIGNGGNNILDGGRGADRMFGEGGSDTYLVDNPGDTVTEEYASGGTDTVLSEVSWTLGENLENLTLTGTAALDATGNALDNVLTGNSAANRLAGGAGADTLSGGAGNDTYLFGPGSGQDTVIDVDGTPGNVDSLRVADVVQAADVHLRRDASDSLVVALNDGADQMLLSHWFADPAGRVERIQFADGTAWDLIELLQTGINSLPSGSVTISGTPEQNQTLTATNTLADADGLGTVGYQWQVSRDASNWTAIDGATASEFTLSQAQVGRQLRALASYVDGRGTLEAVASAATTAVLNVNDAPMATGDIASRSVNSGESLAWQFPTDLFADVDAGDTLALSVVRAGDASLPTWLGFDPASRTLSGTPTTTDVGSLDLALVATDRAGASARLAFALEVNGPNRVINGGVGDDRLFGGVGDDLLSGGPGSDALAGGDGNDVLQVFADGLWPSGFYCRNDGSPGNPGSSAIFAIAGKGRSFDAFDGGAGNDLLIGTSGDDALALDDGFSPNPNGDQPRLTGIERIEAGDGDDVVDLSSGRWAYGNVAIDGGSGDDVLWSSSGSDSLSGGNGKDALDGGWGRDWISGDAGDDALRGAAGGDTLSGGSGNDSIDEGDGDGFLLGGAGDDTLAAGSGRDLIAFNAGDGRDTLIADGLSDNSLSLGGGIRYQDLALSRVGNDLLLDTGGADSLRFAAWYGAAPIKSVKELQILTEAMADFDADSNDPLFNRKVQVFDFAALSEAFDIASAADPTLTRWHVVDRLLANRLTASDTAAFGGDLARQYGISGTLGSFGSARRMLDGSTPGESMQALTTPAGLPEGLVSLA